MTMSLLPKETRSKYFKYLGLGEYNKNNILRFQKIAFSDPKEHDSKYGARTDIALRHWYNVAKNAKNFSPGEFKCKCKGRYCNGYPTWMKAKELKHIQTIRSHYNIPMQITSGLRCEKFNKEIGGSVKDSKHMTGYAVDFYMKGVTDTFANRRKAINYIKTLKNHNYTYGNGINSNGISITALNMGNALHTDTK